MSFVSGNSTSVAPFVSKKKESSLHKKVSSTGPSPLQSDDIMDSKPTAKPHGLHSILLRHPTPIDEHQTQMLIQQGYTRGLVKSLDEMRNIFAIRFWIIDNSSSMTTTDGHRIVPSHDLNQVKMIPCSRWEEIRECVNYHIKMAGLIDAPTNFRFLNKPANRVLPQEFSVGVDHIERNNNLTRSETLDKDVKEAIHIMSGVGPHGVTPLTRHIMDIHKEISNIAPTLNELGKKAVIVIATDGLPTSQRGGGSEAGKQEFVNALRSLEGLPVWVVIRLCTDEEHIVDFYNDLDEQLELSLEVLDDFSGEALEVKGENPWLNYTLPLHRLREMGYHDRVFDMLDERLLTKTELRDFCCLLFGEDQLDGIPDPSLDWSGFLDEVERLLSNEKHMYDPVKKTSRPLMSAKKLNRNYRPRDQGCTIM